MTLLSERISRKRVVVLKQKWAIGNFVFEHNPEADGQSFDIIGDTVRTLGGNVISQPTGVTEGYALVGTVFSGLPKKVSERYVAGAGMMDYCDSKLHFLDISSRRIHVYNKNFGYISGSASLSFSGNGFTAFNAHLYSGNIRYLVATSGGSASNPVDYVHTFNNNFQVVSTKTFLYNNTSSCGWTYCNNYLWTLRDNGTLCRVNYNTLAVDKTVDLPYVPYGYYGYHGITSYDGYLVVPYWIRDEFGVYYIDPNNGVICGHFKMLEYEEFNDVAIMDDVIMFLDKNGSLVKMYSLVKSPLLVYQLRKMLFSSTFLSMTNENGEHRRISVKNYNISREGSHPYLYKVNIVATSVDRGV